MAGIIPYLVYLINLTPTPVANVVSNVDTNSTTYQNPIITATPYVVPSATPSITIENKGKDSLTQWIAQSNWPANLANTVYRIVMCESGGQVGISSNPPYVGLMQANVNFWGRVSADPIAELNQGYEIYKQQGWSAWECY